jgi:hypothetical protein
LYCPPFLYLSPRCGLLRFDRDSVAPLEAWDGMVNIVGLGLEVAARHVFREYVGVRLVSSQSASRDIRASGMEILGRVILSKSSKRH